MIHNDTYAAIDPTKIDHTGHAVFISGASRGLGRAMALSFAKAGPSCIAVTGRTPPESVVQDIYAAAAAAGRKQPRVLPIGIEASSQAAVQSAATLVEKEFGRLDVVVNNAGVFGDVLRITESSPENWWSTMGVNLHGPYLVFRYFIPLLLKSNGLATVVNVSSVGAHLTTEGASAYQTSKLALLRLTEHASNEYADQGLVTYCIHPGNIPTDMVGGMDGLPDVFKKGESDPRGQLESAN